jgi:SAM-dependent methyltransferase
MRLCAACGFVGNPENRREYTEFSSLTQFKMKARVGTAERRGREFHMAQMGLDILGATGVDVLVYGAGRSLDNLHIVDLPSVDKVAIADVMHLRHDADFVDSSAPVTRRFGLVIACEVIEHFLEPRVDFAKLLDYVEPDGLLVCSTNIYDGRRIARQAYIFTPGHTAYYSPRSLGVLAEENGFAVDFRLPEIATGSPGPRKRYVLFTRSPAVRAATAEYFGSRMYAPAESLEDDR